MSYFVYILRSLKDKSFYVGISKDTRQRLRDHNYGDSKYTKGHRPYELIYKEKFIDRPSARKREKFLKSGTGREFIKKKFPGSSVGRAGGCKFLQLSREIGIEKLGEFREALTLVDG